MLPKVPPDMSLLSRLKLRIGPKLAISAGLGIVLVVGLVTNQWFVNHATLEHSDAAAREQGRASDLLRAEVAIHRAATANRQLRLAVSKTDVDGAIEIVRASAAEGLAGLDAARAKSGVDDTRVRIEKMRAMFDDYIAAVVDTGEKRGAIIALWAERERLLPVWHKTIGTLLQPATLAGQPSRAAMDLTIRQADAALADARIATWKYVALADPALVDRVLRSAKASTDLLRKLRGLTDDEPILDEAEKLIGLADNFSANMKQMITIGSELDAIELERTTPLVGALGSAMADLGRYAIGRATRHTEGMRATIERSEWIGLATGALVVVVLIGSALFSAATIARPIRRIGEVLGRLADGDKVVDIPYGHRVDEVGDTARAAAKFKDNLARMEALEAEQRAAGERAAAERRTAMLDLADGFETAVGRIIDTVSSAATELEAAAGTLTQTADMTQELSTTVAAASAQASANVQSVAGATEQLSGSVTEISQQVQESSRIAAEAVAQAGEIDVRVTALSQAASRIGDVVKLITAIAEQTNLLALNATIEAARAGEAGKGFAVVASEVKSLANQTAKATGDISVQIQEIQTATSSSVTAIKAIGGTIDRISSIASSIAAAVEEQAVASEDISRNIVQAARGTSQVATTIAEVDQGAGATGAASTQVLASAQTLSSESGQLKVAVARFLTTVRAA